MNNGQILYLYDAKLTNPNGDPDEENRPRMDYERDLCLVSDLRLKRYIRDYRLMQGDALYVQKIDDEPVTSANRVKGFEKGGKLDFDEILKQFIDVRLFGATITAKNDNKAFTGPVQFNWGYSLNKTELLESSITSHFSSSESKSQGAIGKDYRVKYALIAFSGTISAERAKKTLLSENDLSLLDDAMVNAIPLLATRSKIGQYPRFYLRLEFADGGTMLRDLRSYIKLESDFNEQAIRDVNEYKIDVTALKNYLESKKEKIKKVYCYADPALQLVNEGEAITAEALLDRFETVNLD